MNVNAEEKRRLAHYVHGLLEVPLAFAGKPTMMSVEICASAWRGSGRPSMSRNLAER